MEQYYKASGKFSPLSILIFLLISTIILPLLAVAYAYSIWYMPIVYLAALMTVLFGLMTGYVTSSLVIKLGKVRNTTLALFMGFLASLMALYFHWAFWTTLVGNSGMGYSLGDFGVTVSNVNLFQTLQLVLHPNELLNTIKEINAQGTWTLKGSVVSGTFLTVIWAIEALIVIICSTYMAYLEAKKPFSESNETWFKEKEVAVNLIEDKSAFILALEKAQYNILDTVNKMEGTELSHTVLTLFYSDSGNFYLSAVNKMARVDENKKVAYSDDSFLEYILIDAKQGQRLLSL